MALENVPQVQVGHPFRRNIRVCCNEMRHLHESVHAHIDCVVSLGRLQLYHKIH